MDELELQRLGEGPDAVLPDFQEVSWIRHAEEANNFTILFWNASRVLMQYLKEGTGGHEVRSNPPPPALQRHLVLELGAGLGLLGVTLSDEYGAHVWLSDLGEVVPLINKNIDTFKARGRAATVEGICELMWGDRENATKALQSLMEWRISAAKEEEVKANKSSGPSTNNDDEMRRLTTNMEIMSRLGSISGDQLGLAGLAPLCHGFDVIIACELIYDDNHHAALVATLKQVMCSNTTCVVGFVDRPMSFMFFAKLADALDEPADADSDEELPEDHKSTAGKLFQVQEVTGFDTMGMQEVFLYLVTLSPEAVRRRESLRKCHLTQGRG